MWLRRVLMLILASVCTVLISQSATLASGGNDDNGNDDNGNDNNGAQVRLTTRMTGPLPIKATAKYELEVDDNGVDREFKVEIEHAIPMTTFPVRLNGALIGTITTNIVGEGKLRFEGAAAPTLQSGAVVSAGSMIGVLVDKLDDSEKYYTKVRLRNGTSAEGNVKYIERVMSNGFRRTFSVEVENFVPNDTINIRINGEKVGTVRTNSRGNGEFQLRTPEFIDGPDDGQPMPSTFRPLVPGDRVTVSSLNGIAYLVN